MKQRAESMEAYFSEKITECTEWHSILNADDRADEAAFQKIQANVYGIFQSILPACIRLGGGEDSAVKAVFLDKHRQITANWEQALALAAENQDQKHSAIERIKLDTAGEIRNVFLNIWEGEA